MCLRMEDDVDVPLPNGLLVSAKYRGCYCEATIVSVCSLSLCSFRLPPSLLGVCRLSATAFSCGELCAFCQGSPYCACIGCAPLLLPAKRRQRMYGHGCSITVCTRASRVPRQARFVSACFGHCIIHNVTVVFAAQGRQGMYGS